MRDIANHLEFRPLFVAVACACLAQGAAHAADLTATGSYRLGADPRVDLIDTGNFSVDVPQFPSSTSPGAAPSRFASPAVTVDPNPGAVSSAGLHDYGSSNGRFGSRSSGYGSYDVTGAFSIVETFTNTTASAAHALFNFSITPGFILNDVNSVLSGSQYVASGISFNVKSNGSSVWSSSASLRTDTSGVKFTTTGANLYTPELTNSSYYSINGVDKSIDLGVLNAGQSLTLEYDLQTFANGNAPAGPDLVVPDRTFTVPEQWVDFCDNGYGCYGYGAQLVPGEVITIPGYTIPGAPSGSHASSGDPFRFDLGSATPDFYASAAPPAGGVSITLAAIPEPSSVALMLGGLGVVGFMARRRRQR